jgi:hypothetical protein
MFLDSKRTRIENTSWKHLVNYKLPFDINTPIGCDSSCANPLGTVNQFVLKENKMFDAARNIAHIHPIKTLLNVNASVLGSSSWLGLAYRYGVKELVNLSGPLSSKSSLSS